MKSSTNPHTPLQFEGYSKCRMVWLLEHLQRDSLFLSQITVYQTSVCIWITVLILYTKDNDIYEVYWQSREVASAIWLRCDFCLPSMNAIKIKARLGLTSCLYPASQFPWCCVRRPGSRPLRPPTVKDTLCFLFSAAVLLS